MPVPCFLTCSGHIAAAKCSAGGNCDFGLGLELSRVAELHNHGFKEGAERPLQRALRVKKSRPRKHLARAKAAVRSVAVH